MSILLGCPLIVTFSPQLYCIKFKTNKTNAFNFLITITKPSIYISFSIVCPFVTHLRILHQVNVEPIIYSQLIPFDITV